MNNNQSFFHVTDYFLIFQYKGKTTGHAKSHTEAQNSHQKAKSDIDITNPKKKPGKSQIQSQKGNLFHSGQSKTKLKSEIHRNKGHNMDDEYISNQELTANQKAIYESKRKTAEMQKNQK